MSETAVPRVLVTGATGRIGGAVIDRLVERGVPIRALTHGLESTAELPAGVEVVGADLTEPDSLDEPLRGVDAVFLVWTAPPVTAPAVIDLLASHVRRVVFLSAPHRTPHPFFQQPNPMAELYATIEDRIVASGLAWTFLRPGMLDSNALSWWAPTIRAGGEVRWTYGDAETAPIDDRDVAAVAATILSREGDADGDHVLTGPESLSQAEQVRIIGEVLGRPVPFVDLPPEGFRKEAEGTWPPAALDMLLDAWGATMGVPAFVTPTVSELLGRPPGTFREWVADHVAAFTADATGSAPAAADD